MYDCIVIGAGPAGLMAAIEASKNHKTLLIEKNAAAGKKLLLTGGRRCNVTNLKSNDDFLHEINYNIKYLYSTINKFGPNDVHEYFIRNKIVLKEEKDNRIFPASNKSIDILNALLTNTKKVEFKYNENVLNIINDPVKKVITNKNSYITKNIIIATGGSSFKRTGSTGDNIKFAKILNQPVIPLFPAEVGIILEEKNDLAGTSFENVEVKINNKSAIGNLIFTHFGLSGEAIMKISEYIYKDLKKEVIIDFLPNVEINELKTEIQNFNREKEVVSFLNTMFSKRFSLYLINKLKINKKMKSLNNKEIDRIVNIIKSFLFKVKRTENLERAYVTGGGVDMKYINSQTMESKINKGIYFVGEALDVHGPIGGYNITLALSTGYTAGTSI